MKRIIAKGHRKPGADGWALVQEGERPLPVPTRRLLARYYPELPGDDVTPEQADAWFNRMFADKERVAK